MNAEFIWGIVRHILTMVAGVLATSGYISADQVSQFVGAVIFLAMVVFSAVNKIRAGKAIDTALELPEGSTKEDLAKQLKLK